MFERRRPLRWDGLKNLASLDLSSILTHVIHCHRRRSNVDADLWWIDFTHMSMSVLADAITRDCLWSTESARMPYWSLAMLDFWDCPARSYAVTDVQTRQWEDFTLGGLHTLYQNGYADGVQQLLVYGCDRTLAGQLWYPQQLPSSLSGAEQPHRRLHLT